MNNQHYELRTQRLHLRPMRPGDADRLVALVGDFEVAKTLSRVPHPYSRTDAIDWLNRVSRPHPPDQTSFALDAGNGLIGSIGFRIIDDKPEVGFWLARSHWGQGLMSEAVEAAIAWFFSATDHDALDAGVFEGNPASLRIQHKLGFEVTGRRLVHGLAQGRDLPHIDTRVTRQAFKAHTA